jgi:pimeloyl-ACP methyl ester carboxylesterase
LMVRNIQDWGIEFGRSAWHNPDLITDEIWEGYLLPLRADNWDRALYEAVIAGNDAVDLTAHLDAFTLPTLVITGDDDRIIPTDSSIRLAEALPNAGLVVIENCGHIPHEECPDAFLEAVFDFLAELE